MDKLGRKQARWALLLLLSALLLVALVPSNRSRVAAQMPMASTGIVCTTSSSPNAQFTLTTKSGYIGTPDGNVIYMWGYADGDNPFQHPGPVLCVNQNDTVTILLKNTLPDDVSIIFPGQQNVLANGVPAQPQFDGGGALTSLTNVAAKNGGTMTYSFVASEPGTYLYQSGTEPMKQVNMGLFGALVVRPAAHPDWAYNRADTQFNPDTEYVLLLSEIDPMLHEAVERRQTFDMNNYKPRYWLVNGRGFPDSIAPNYASWLPTQPYGSLARIHPHDSVANPLLALTRYLSVGTTEFPFHPHGNVGRVIGHDGRLLEGPGGQDLSYEKFTFVIGPGQTWDATFGWVDAEQYDPNTNPVPVTVPNLADLVYGMLYSGSPYLGEQGPFPPGGMTLNECGEYYIISHNHALQQVVAWDATMAGPVTFVRVDPPLPNNCP
jgi:hypothetical protein